MDAGDFLALADKLSQAAAEAEWRSAVSRAYYAAFHVSRGPPLTRVLQIQDPSQREGSHLSHLSPEQLGRPHPVKSAGDNLDVLRVERNRADYDLNYSYTQVRACTQVQIAKDVIRILGIATLEPLKTQITDAIKIYERDVLKDVTWMP